MAMVVARRRGGVLDVILIVIEALLIATLIRTFLFQPFNIPSGSMKASLLIGDYLFVNKFAYGFSRHSFPYSLPGFQGRIWAGAPERGDVVVFKLPCDGETDYIKRVIGLPGDRVQMIGGIVNINGQPVRRERVEDYRMPDAFGRLVPVRQFRETLPNGRSYLTLKLAENGYLDNTEVFVVPPNSYFMMGDNRDNSTDSRVLPTPDSCTGVGYVPLDNIVGRASFIFFSVEEGERAWQFWRWPWTVRWERIGQSIQ